MFSIIFGRDTVKNAHLLPTSWYRSELDERSNASVWNTLRAPLRPDCRMSVTAVRSRCPPSGTRIRGGTDRRPLQKRPWTSAGKKVHLNMSICRTLPRTFLTIQNFIQVYSWSSSKLWFTYVLSAWWTTNEIALRWISIQKVPLSCSFD